MKRFSKVLVLILAVAMCFTACFTLVGCGEKGDVKLTVFTMFGVGDDHNSAYQENVDKFTAANPNVFINDVSVTGATNTFDSMLEARFASKKSTPDVLYAFAPGRNAGFKDQLATVDEIKAKFPDYTKNVQMGSAPDDYTLPFKGITEGIQYDAARYTSADFASYSAFIAACKRENAKDEAYNATTKKTGSKIADPIGEINYWANYILLEKMGADLVGQSSIDKAFIDAKSTQLAAAIDEIKRVYTEIGFSGNTAVNYGEEKGAMWNGERSLTVDGSWNVLGFYGDKYGNKKAINDDSATAGIKVSNIVVGDSASKYVLAGFTHGWMISKECLKDEKRLEAAVKFIRTQIDGVNAYATTLGGIYAVTGATPKTDYKMSKEFADLMNVQGATMVVPIDDKFELVACKNAFFDGIKAMLTTGSDKTGATIVADMKASYKN